MIFCTKNKGAISFLESDDIVEITCNVNASGVIPKNFTDADIDSYAAELIRRMKHYERTAAKAILNKDKSLAVEAIALHPLVESFTIAQKLVDQYLELNKDYCSGW